MSSGWNLQAETIEAIITAAMVTKFCVIPLRNPSAIFHAGRLFLILHISIMMKTKQKEAIGNSAKSPTPYSNSFKNKLLKYVRIAQTPMKVKRMDIAE